MNYNCPHCGIVQIPTDRSSGNFAASVNIGKFAEMKDKEAESLRVVGSAIRCADPECNRISVTISLASGMTNNFGQEATLQNSHFLLKQLYPGRSGKPFPEYVPSHMLADYDEAWSIIDLSPKSSATLARRCLQSMIRDFCGITKRTLYDEINALKSLADEDKLPRGVDPDTIGAMFALKDVGNIGAHMSEIDGIILDVDAGEAQKLLGLIEMLFADWYIARGRRAVSIAGVLGVSEAKKPKLVALGNGSASEA